MSHALFYCKVSAWFILVALLSFGCNRGSSSSVYPSPDLTAQSAVSPEPTLTPPPPTSTSVPLAARVNGWELSLAEYQAELVMYQASSGTNLATQDEQLVLNDLVDQALLAQAALNKGFLVDDTLLKERMDRIETRISEQGSITGSITLPAWINAHGYTEESFQQALRRSIASAWMRDQIVAAVPKTAEQVHARQILLYNADDANAALALLQSGSNFDELAFKYDPVTSGDLGWFPRGYLVDFELEEAIFNLQPGQYSLILQSRAGFHIILVIEREAERPLDPQALQAIQAKALQAWIEAQRNTADIQVFVP